VAERVDVLVVDGVNVADVGVGQGVSLAFERFEGVGDEPPPPPELTGAYAALLHDGADERVERDLAVRVALATRAT
jgi:hypothetical protein